MEIKKLSDWVPEGEVSGTGLIIKEESGRYLFMLPSASKIRFDKGLKTIHYAGVGGRRIPGESFIGCAQREAEEELGVRVELESSAKCYMIDRRGSIKEVELGEKPKPLILFEKVNPVDAPWRESRDKHGKWIYYGVVFLANLRGIPEPRMEVGGILFLTQKQIIWTLKAKPTLKELVANGASLIRKENIPLDTKVYPIGTPYYYALLLAHLGKA